MTGQKEWSRFRVSVHEILEGVKKYHAPDSYAANLLTFQFNSINLCSAQNDLSLYKLIPFKLRNLNFFDEKWVFLNFGWLGTKSQDFGQRLSIWLFCIFPVRSACDHLQSNQLLLSWVREYAQRRAQYRFCSKNKHPPGRLPTSKHGDNFVRCH